METINSIIIGRRQPCKHCGNPIRIVYITRHNSNRLIEDPGENLDTGRLIEHNCPVNGVDSR